MSRWNVPDIVRARPSNFAARRASASSRVVPTHAPRPRLAGHRVRRPTLTTGVAVDRALAVRAFRWILTQPSALVVRSLAALRAMGSNPLRNVPWDGSYPGATTPKRSNRRSNARRAGYDAGGRQRNERPGQSTEIRTFTEFQRGTGGIRTPGPCGPHAFKARAFVRSATVPPARLSAPDQADLW